MDLHLQELVRVPVDASVAELGGPVEVKHLVGESRGRKETGEEFEPSCPVPGLLLQLPGRTLLPTLPLPVPDPGRDLVEVSTGRVAILIYQEDLGILLIRRPQNGQNRRGPTVPDHLQLARGSIREAYGVEAQLHDPPVVNHPGGDQRLIRRRVHIHGLVSFLSHCSSDTEG